MFSTDDTTQVQEATEALGVAVVGLDLGSLIPGQLKDVVGLGERIERLGHGLKTRAAARVADSQVWRGSGDRSAEDWLAGQAGTSRAEAARLLKTGKALESLPQVSDAVGRGGLSPRQAEAIAGAAGADPSAQGRLLDSAKHKTLRDLKDECARTRTAADPDPEATARRIHARRCYRTWVDAGGVGNIALSGPSALIARMDNAIRQRAGEFFNQARRAGRREPHEAYGFDAAEALVCGAGGTEVPRGADAKIIVRVDHAALLRGRALQGEICEIAGVGPIAVSVVEEWMDDAFVAAILTKGEQVQRVVHLGRRFRSTQRTAMQWSDPLCARRGCDARLGLEYDHFEDWADTHVSRVGAAKRFCKSCHRLKTSGWVVSLPDGEGQCDFSPPPEPEHQAAVGHAVRSRGRG